MSLEGQVDGKPIALKLQLPAPPIARSTWVDGFKTGPLYLLCILIGWLIATGISYFGSDIERAEYKLAVANYRSVLSKDLDAVRAHIVVGNYPMAQALLDDSQSAAETLGLPPSAMVKLLSDQIIENTRETAGLPPVVDTTQPAGPVLGLTKEIVQDQFFSADRRNAALAIAAAFESADQPSREATVDVLLDAVIPQGEDDRRRYRVNIYIALALSLLPPKSVTRPDDIDRLMALRDTAEYGADSQFRLNVDTAIARQASPT